MNKIGIEIIKGLTNLLMELDKKEEVRTEKEERRHKELLEVLKGIGVQDQLDVRRDHKEELKNIEFHINKKEKKDKKEEPQIEMQNLFEGEKEPLLMDELHEKILEAGRNDKGGEIQELNFNNEDEEDTVKEKLGSDSNETFALVPEEVLEENKKALDEIMENFDNEENVEKKKNNLKTNQQKKKL